MASYRLELKKSAQKEFSKLPAVHSKRISEAIDGLTVDPFPSGFRKLVGSEFKYRIRIGDYRVIYEVREAVLIVFVVKIGHRKDIYR